MKIYAENFVNFVLIESYVMCRVWLAIFEAHLEGNKDVRKDLTRRIFKNNIIKFNYDNI